MTYSTRPDGIVTGTDGNNTMLPGYVDATGDRIDGNDAILPGTVGNDDVIVAGAGNDCVDAGLGNDEVYGGAGNDTLSGGQGNDTVYGDTNLAGVTLGGTGGTGGTRGSGGSCGTTPTAVYNDVIYGGDGNDALFGELGNDKVYGGAGNDTLSGGVGANHLEGGSGDDLFIGGTGTDTFNGGSGQDNIDYSASGAGVTVNLATSQLSGGDATGDVIANGIDGVIGSAFADNLTGFDQQGTDPSDVFTNEFWGNGGNDTITGLNGNDRIYGGRDNDLVSGGNGNDTVSGDEGNDTVYGGAGNDIVNGGDGNDVIDASSGNPLDQRPDAGYPGLYPADTDPLNDRDSVDACAGDDIIRTGDDDDLITAGTGNDWVDAGVDDDTVLGGDGDDTIIGAEGSDSIDAGAGDDLVYGGYAPNVPDSVNIPDATDLAPGNGLDNIHGGDGNDTIFGMDDDDTLFGDAGADSLDGGIDDDAVFGGSGSDSLTGGDGADTLSGGDDRDLITGGSIGDVADGDEGGDDYDTLDLAGSGPLKIIYDSANPENGTVQFLDPTTRDVVGTMSFKNIENVIPCFTPGTLIATPRGEVPVESLKVGDKIITRDNGMQEIRWLGRRDLSWSDLAAAPHLKPILVRQGSLGNGLPERDMMVSPNHRLLVANDRTALYFDEHEVLVAAKHLAAGKGIHSVDAAGTSYIHFMCDRHEVVLSNGAWTESFQPGDMTLKGMGNAQRSEIYDLFPALKTETGIDSYTAARRTLKRHEALLIAR